MSCAVRWRCMSLWCACSLRVTLHLCGLRPLLLHIKSIAPLAPAAGDAYAPLLSLASTRAASSSGTAASLASPLPLLPYLNCQVEPTPSV